MKGRARKRWRTGQRMLLIDRASIDCAKAMKVVVVGATVEVVEVGGAVVEVVVVGATVEVVEVGGAVVVVVELVDVGVSMGAGPQSASNPPGINTCELSGQAVATSPTAMMRYRLPHPSRQGHCRPEPSSACRRLRRPLLRAGTCSGGRAGSVDRPSSKATAR